MTATRHDIFNEPDWTRTHNHRIGLRDREDRFPGLTNEPYDSRYSLEHESEQKIAELRAKHDRGELLSVRDFMTKQEDFHLKRPEVHPKHWRYVLHTSEGFIKNDQSWLINEQQKKKADSSKEQPPPPAEAPKPSHLTLEQQTMLQAIKAEAEYVRGFQANDGQGRSPAYSSFVPSEIDEADQFTPDNWIPRTDHLMRLTGKHPLNGEPNLTEMMDAGVITPNILHYVRSHGPVPHLLWENHRLQVSAGDGEEREFLMDELVDRFPSINIPVIMACDGNRRKEVNMLKRSKGFDWGPGGVSCAYWKGVLLRDVLLAANVEKYMAEKANARLWVNFRGTEYCSDGQYETCVPLDYVMDPINDVLLAYEMNDAPLPPDHGYPLRVIIPGFVGGRAVKWLERVWVTDFENHSHYHIWDNRVVPTFVEDRESEAGLLMYHHPSTACYEQNINSVIASPEQGEKLDLQEMEKGGKRYRIRGYAYNGAGNEVQRVEVSLDGRKSWLYCTRQFPDTPIRHNKKFWAWIHWHVEVDLRDLLHAETIIVRAWDANKNTQPENITWNLEGMMNNSQYTVKSEVIKDPKTNQSFRMFRHPTEPGTGPNGWMKPSLEDQEEENKRQSSVPDNQFTREEIEKHHSDDDCWIVLNGRVYDATSVLSWHPGGKAAIMAHAGRVHMSTTEEYESIHDEYANGRLQECILGSVTKKTREFIKKEAEETARSAARSTADDDHIALKRHKWTQAKLIDKKSISKDTKRYRFALPSKDQKLGLETGQHILIGFHFEDQLIMRSYTPIRPIRPCDEDGTFDLAVKTYYPDPGQPGGTMSNIFDCLRPGEEVEIKGPTGEIRYQGFGRFVIDEKEFHFERVTLVLGGSGITPGYQVIARILLTEGDETKIRVVDANKTEDDILMREELDAFAREHPGQIEVAHVLSHPGEGWKGERGLVNGEILHRCAFAPDEKSIALLCGPPAMIQKAVLPVLLEWGYDEDRNLFGF
ncbi:hypothetical protein FE257_001212 [Aspergillus nanangensis]|uniref:Nitrate reductase [NADPH] n=1 Tax=Aspergillus nanangensis TaxID=2582783 RepID=A0AAD4CE58_ASPNN|nr:hypothetical protein FE257_001212 [Aspergillus nanangensis]